MGRSTASCARRSFLVAVRNQVHKSFRSGNDSAHQHGQVHGKRRETLVLGGRGVAHRRVLPLLKLDIAQLQLGRALRQLRSANTRSHQLLLWQMPVAQLFMRKVE